MFNQLAKELDAGNNRHKRFAKFEIRKSRIACNNEVDIIDTRVLYAIRYCRGQSRQSTFECAGKGSFAVVTERSNHQGSIRARTSDH